MIQKNKKGLSDIVITLMIVVLALVAIGGVWAVVNNLLKGQTQSADLASRCMNTNLQVTKAVCTGATVPKVPCLITIRQSGSEPIAGVIILMKDTVAGTVMTTPLDTAGVITIEKVYFVASVAGLTTNPNFVEVIPYLKDASGNVARCTTSASLSFTVV